jgi:ABC-type phosphate transport system substrate-binding protein
MIRYCGTKGTLLVAAMALSGTTCTLALDHSAVQCRTDADCIPFHYHPRCTNSVCVPSQLQPEMCTVVNPPSVIPQTQLDFLNGCSPNAMLDGNPGGACLSFTQVFDPDAAIKPPPAPSVTMNPAPAVPTSMCKDLVAPDQQILYITGSSNFAPLLQELAQVIVKSINIVPVFRTTTSCTGVRSMNRTSATYAGDHNIKDPTAANDTYAQIFLGDGTPAVSCLLGSTGVPVDLGESEIAQDTCGPPANPSDSVGESLGPILPIVFVVPKFSSQKMISVAAAQQVFGGGGGVPPWEKPLFLYIRGQGTATLRLVAKQIGLMPNQFWGTDQGTALNMASNLAVLTQPEDAEAALGMIGSDFYDQDKFRGSLKALGLQVTDQYCAYLPDSSLTSRDKINVRDGHYPLWGRIHFFAARSNGMLTSPVATTFLSLFTNPTLDPDILAALIKAGFVPPCAMKVTRDSELGDFTYADPPPVSCGCAFDVQVGADARPECVPCSEAKDCPADRHACSYHYCEQVKP